MSTETKSEPGVVVEPVFTATVFAEPAVQATPLDSAAPTDTAAPLSRRQLRELLGPLTTVSASENVPAQTHDELPPTAPRAVPPVAARTLAQTPPFCPTGPADSSVARPWIGAAVPLVLATSAPLPVAIEPSPTAPPAALVVAPASVLAEPAFSRGSLGFTLPPDPFAALSAAGEVSPPPFIPLSPVAAPAVPTLAISATSTTAAVWIYAVLPVVHAAAIWLVLGMLDLGTNPVIRYSVIGAPLFLYLLLAVIDRRELRGRGLARTGPAIFAVIPPLYLLVRAIRVGSAGVIPLIVWLLLQTAAFSFILLQLPVVFALVPLTSTAQATPVVVESGPITTAQRAVQLTPAGMAAELTRQTLAKKLTFSSISCPSIPVTSDGTAVSCVGTLASVKMNLNVVIDSTLPNSAFALVSEAPTS